MKTTMRMLNGAMTEQLAKRVEAFKRLLAARCSPRSAAGAHFVRLALGEAAALAWQTGVPHLVFPTLAEEKLAALCGWLQRQERIRRHGFPPRLGTIPDTANHNPSTVEAP